MKPFLENTNLNELEAIQEYMDSHGITDPEKLTERDYEILEESKKSLDSNAINDIKSTLETSMNHIVKYEKQPYEQKRGWLITIRNGCARLNNLKSGNDFKNFTPEEIEKIYQKSLKDSKFRREAKEILNQLPKTAKEAFGTNDINDLKDWKYIKDNIIMKYARDDIKDKMESKWDELKNTWDKQ